MSIDTIHVYPVNDTKPHVLMVEIGPTGLIYSYCACKPEFKEENNHIIVVHNSFDGREGVEWAREILNKPLP